MFINADAKAIPLADESVQCCITSPPYYGLRSYVEDGHPLKKLEIGLERTPQEYVDGLVRVFREVWRVMKSDGVLWMNMGDSYAQGGKHTDKQEREKGENKRVERQKIRDDSKGVFAVPSGWGNRGDRAANTLTPGIKPKDLIGIPWMVAFALRADGWYLRSDIIWHKPNPMPESVTDRPTKAHEYIFLLSKSERYFYDADAIQERAAAGWNNSSFTDERDQLTKPGLGMKPRNGGGNYSKKYADAQPNHGGESNRVDTGYRNKRTVWTVATSPYSGAHFATFPPKLVEPMILAGSAKGDLVLDPFAGTATVGRVAIKHQRRFVGLELNQAYIELAQDRTSNVQVLML